MDAACAEGSQMIEAVLAVLAVMAADILAAILDALLP